MSRPNEGYFEDILTAQRRNIYVAGEDMDLVWDEDEVTKFDTWWRDGYDITEIANMLDRDCDEVAILAIDRARHGRIKPRSGGIFGKSIQAQGA